MLPEFDEHGNLPPGIHQATLHEVVDRFGDSRSLKRRSVTNSFEEFYDFIQEFAVGIYINGSYVTSKLAPNDVDLLVILPSDFDFASPGSRQLVRFMQRKALHIFAYVQGRHAQEIQDLISWFTEDRQGNPKGIIYVEVR